MSPDSTPPWWYVRRSLSGGSYSSISLLLLPTESCAMPNTSATIIRATVVEAIARWNAACKCHVGVYDLLLCARTNQPHLCWTSRGMPRWLEGNQSHLRSSKDENGAESFRLFRGKTKRKGKLNMEKENKILQNGNETNKEHNINKLTSLTEVWNADN